MEEGEFIMQRVQHGSIQVLEDYFKNSKERLISATSYNIGKKRTKTNKETKMGRRITVWIFQATNWQGCTWEDRLVSVGYVVT